MGNLYNEMFYLKILINSNYSVSEPISRIYERYDYLRSKSKCIESRKVKIKKLFNV